MLATYTVAEDSTLGQMTSNHDGWLATLSSYWISVWGEIEMSWTKYKDAEKYFTLAVTYYSIDNVGNRGASANNFKKLAVLVKKEQCHWSLLQIKEAINAFKMAKVAELALEQARGSKLKTAKENELSALGNFRNYLSCTNCSRQLQATGMCM